MDIKDVKQVLGKTETLGLDAQPIRDLINKIQKREVDCKEFEHILSTLNSIIDSSRFAHNSKPVQVQLLLNQVSKKLKESKQQKIYDKGTNISNDFSDSVNMEILNIVSKLSKDINEIKSQKPQQVVIDRVVEDKYESKSNIGVTKAPVLSGAFVNPMVGQKDQKYKSNINIESKEGDNIGNKLSKLKKLKNKNG